MLANAKLLWPALFLAGSLACWSCMGAPAPHADYQARGAQPAMMPPPKPAPPLMIAGPAPQAPATVVAQAGSRRDDGQLAPAASSRQPFEGMSPADPVAKLRQLYRLAATQYEAADSYVVRMHRREQVNGKDHPEEVMLFKFRKQPWSVYFKFIGPVAKGREVVYVKGRYDNAIHTLTAAGDMPFMPAGRHIALAPDNIFVRSASRHPITEAGIGNLIERFGQLLQFAERNGQQGGNTALVKYLGPNKRPEFANLLETVAQVIPPRYESALPHGGTRYWFFDPVLHLPMLVITQDQRGHEVEYYSYDNFQAPVNLSDADFNPDFMGHHGS